MLAAVGLYIERMAEKMHMRRNSSHKAVCHITDAVDAAGMIAGRTVHDRSDHVK